MHKIGISFCPEIVLLRTLPLKFYSTATKKLVFKLPAKGDNSNEGFI